jgi:hypothetical protein
MNQYSTNLTDNQYNAIIHIFDVKRKRNYSVQDILKGLFYILKTFRFIPIILNFSKFYFAIKSSLAICQYALPIRLSEPVYVPLCIKYFIDSVSNT